MTPARRAAYLERFIVHGHYSPAVAAEAMRLSEACVRDMEIALSHVVEPRVRMRIIEEAGRALQQAVCALSHPQARRLAS